jgi:hypothetical protein
VAVPLSGVQVVGRREPGAPRQRPASSAVDGSGGVKPAGSDENERNRVSVGVEPFLDQFLQLRIFYRVYNGPEDEPATNRDEFTLEGHLFF